MNNAGPRKNDGAILTPVVVVGPKTSENIGSLSDGEPVFDIRRRVVVIAGGNVYKRNLLLASLRYGGKVILRIEAEAAVWPRDRVDILASEMQRMPVRNLVCRCGLRAQRKFLAALVLQPARVQPRVGFVVFERKP